MAQFRILKGISTRLPVDKTEGNIYYTHDNSLFHIDFVNEDGELVRKILNADQATKDADGNDIVATYETKTEAERKLEQAKSYTDLALKDITTDFQTVSYEKMITVNSENQTIFEVPFETFDPVNDTLDVHHGRLYLTEGEDYTLSGRSIVLKEAPEINDTITFTILKNVPALDEEITFIPSMLEDGSIPLSKLEEMPVTATPDWNQNDANADDYIIGRTHYVELEETSTNILEWDGNTEGLTNVIVDNWGYYKVSNSTPDISQLNNISFIVNKHDSGTIEEITAPSSLFQDFGDYITLVQYVYIVKNENVTIDDYYTFKEPGIYFLKWEAETLLGIKSDTNIFTTTSEVVHKLDEKYLPDGLLTQSNLATDSEALEDIAELGLVEVMHHDGTVYYDATGKILTY